MMYKSTQVGKVKNIALVAHDNMKVRLLDWVKVNMDSLKSHNLFATGTTTNLIRSQLDLDIQALVSGPLGGDQQIGAMIVEDKIDMLIFFWDPLEAQPHDPDIKALLRVAAVWNIPVACNSTTADMLISSSMFANEFERLVPDYEQYKQSRNQNLGTLK